MLASNGRLPIESPVITFSNSRTCSDSGYHAPGRDPNHDAWSFCLENVMHFDEVSERRRLLFLKKKKQKDFSPFSGPGAGYGRRMKG